MNTDFTISTNYHINNNMTTRQLNNNLVCPPSKGRSPQITQCAKESLSLLGRWRFTISLIIVMATGRGSPFIISITLVDGAEQSDRVGRGEMDTTGFPRRGYTGSKVHIGALVVQTPPSVAMDLSLCHRLVVGGG